ncbi:MAG: hypothetical protein ACLRMZ_01340 [Blautia marasmi]
MYVNTGYLNHAETDLENMQVPLRINSSGVYRVISRPSMSTLRPKGRADYQLIYIASGSAWFTIGQEKVEVSEGIWSFCGPSSARNMCITEKISQRPSGSTLPDTGQNPSWRKPDLHKSKFSMQGSSLNTGTFSSG